jgi:hypothetical protein
MKELNPPNKRDKRDKRDAKMQETISAAMTAIMISLSNHLSLMA